MNIQSATSTPIANTNSYAAIEKNAQPAAYTAQEAAECKESHSASLDSTRVSTEMTSATLQTSKRIESLAIIGQGISEIPKELPSNLNHLHLSCNAISSISADDFKGLNDLEILDLSGNKLSSIPKDFLKHLPSLRVLILTHNKITELPEDFLSSSAKALHIVNLSGNPMPKPSSLGPFQSDKDFSPLHFTNMEPAPEQTIDE